MQTKICNTCHIEKSITDFSSARRGIFGVRGECKVCCSKKQKIWYYKNQLQILNKNKEALKTNRVLNPWLYIWYDITKRCTNKNAQNYKYYGGRGIKNLFKTSEEVKFLWFRDRADLMKKPSIDRIDNDGDYTIINCVFIEQAEHTRKHKSKPIIQLDKQGNFIKDWESSSCASKQLQISSSCISLVLSHKQSTAGGFKWMYA
jgi:hypothetical protein